MMIIKLAELIEKLYNLLSTNKIVLEYIVKKKILVLWFLCVKQIKYVLFNQTITKRWYE